MNNVVGKAHSPMMNRSVCIFFKCIVEQEEAEEAAKAVDARPDGVEISECGYWNPAALPRPISDFTPLRIHDALAGADYPLPTPIGPRIWLE